MNGRIKDKINELHDLIEELEEIRTVDLDIYLQDNQLRAANERYFEKIVECIVKIAFTIVREKKLEIPEDDDKTIFEVLEKHKIIDPALAKRLQDAKSMRNILAHEYGKIDDKLVFEALAHEIMPDVEAFLNQIKKVL